MDTHNFVDQELRKKGLLIKPITQEYMESRLDDFMKFVNSILNEYGHVYKLWEPKTKEWFLNPMHRKWEFSFVIEDTDGKIALMNFSSIYGVNLHNHCTYVDNKMRGMNLAKLHMIKICQIGLENGINKYEGYWDKGNNGSIILHLKMGFKIESMRKNEQLFLCGDLELIKEQTYQLL